MTATTMVKVTAGAPPLEVGFERVRHTVAVLTQVGDDTGEQDRAHQADPQGQPAEKSKTMTTGMMTIRIETGTMNGLTPVAPSAASQLDTTSEAAAMSLRPDPEICTPPTWTRAATTRMTRTTHRCALEQGDPKRASTTTETTIPATLASR